MRAILQAIYVAATNSSGAAGGGSRKVSDGNWIGASSEKFDAAAAAAAKLLTLAFVVPAPLALEESDYCSGENKQSSSHHMTIEM